MIEWNLLTIGLDAYGLALSVEDLHKLLYLAHIVLRFHVHNLRVVIAQFALERKGGVVDVPEGAVVHPDFLFKIAVSFEEKRVHGALQALCLSDFAFEAVGGE